MEIKKRVTFAIPFREVWDKIIDNTERQVQASTEKSNRIESVDFFGGIMEAGVRA